jgi:kynureninase
MTPTNRAHAESLDAADPLGHLPDRFVVDDPKLIYLDGNSLGRLPRSTLSRLATVAEKEWGSGLIRSWNTWIDLPARCGDLIARSLLGAEPGEVVVSDSTSVNLYKLAVAALDAQPGRDVIVTDDDNFPTDRYVVEGLAAQRGLELRMVVSDPVHGPDLARLAAAIDEQTALVTLSHVAYRSAALADLAAITALAHRSGALVLWDLCHSVGSVPVELAAAGADLAVGCTYKYLNAGPGSPALLYVRAELQGELRSPIWGWFSQEDQFAMGPEYRPVEGIGRFLAGTPPVLALAAVDAGTEMLAEAGIGRVRAKATALTTLAVDLHDQRLAQLGFTLGTPRDAERRGAHVSLRHSDAWRICRALVERADVIPDFRAPDSIRFGLAPLYTRHVDVWDAIDRLAAIVESGEHEVFDAAMKRVT